MDRIDQRITELVLRGESNKAVAKEVGVPEGTVKWRLHRLYEAVGAHNRAQFVLKVHEGGMDRLRALVAKSLEEKEGE